MRIFQRLIALSNVCLVKWDQNKPVVTVQKSNCLMFHWHIAGVVFACSAHGNMIFDILEQSSIQKYTTCWVFLALRHMLYLCILYLYFCICAFDTWEYNFWNPWTILFSKIYHMLGLSGTSSYAVFVYLCICVCVFVHETLGNISFDICGPRALRKCMVCTV